MLYRNNNLGLVVGGIVCTDDEYATLPRLNCRIFCNCVAYSPMYYVRIDNYKQYWVTEKLCNPIFLLASPSIRTSNYSLGQIDGNGIRRRLLNCRHRVPPGRPDIPITYGSLKMAHGAGWTAQENPLRLIPMADSGFAGRKTIGIYVGTMVR